MYLFVDNLLLLINISIVYCLPARVSIIFLVIPSLILSEPLLLVVKIDLKFPPEQVMNGYKNLAVE